MTTRRTNFSWTRERELELAEMAKEDLSFKEISTLTGLNNSTVNQKITRTGFRHLTTEECDYYGVRKWVAPDYKRIDNVDSRRMNRLYPNK